ncbi:MAG: sigma-54 dependent transcriptional regulator [Deltaproteobacteria bacterium]|nr:sigma-54 dependent transcriptional regulator [Deltaproteobacteria bacterium]
MKLEATAPEADKSDLSVCIVDDDPTLVTLLRAYLRESEYNVQSFPDGASFLSALPGLTLDVVLLDLSLPDMDGLDILGQIRARSPDLPVVMITADSDVDRVVAAMNAGAFDYLTKPLNSTRLKLVTRNAAERHRMSVRLAEFQHEDRDGGAFGIIGTSPPMLDLYRQIELVSATDVTVLIHGESGSGKELVAHAIHTQSRRADAPLIAINCSAIPESLQEAEFFGHERGAFTGADNLRKGLFESADGGTLFLDEVAELCPLLQAKLLRVIQERTFTRIGGTQEIASNFRLLAASHRNLMELVREGLFREDLYYRIAVFELGVPPLRERSEDIPLLATQFLDEIARDQEHDMTEENRVTLSPRALETLMSHDWPGNVRELRNAIQRAFLFSNMDTIKVGDLPARVHVRRSDLDPPAPTPGTPIETAAAGQGASPVPPSGSGLPSLNLEELERFAIEEAFRTAGGNVNQALKLLGLSRTTLYRKRKKYGLS